ncbi:MAG: tetratricopeptide repeat protein [Chitinophagaceae bacterium]|nr:MAG: tetratricopeptide repeat protein [Chitinophagaceae bacterium]
MFLQERKIKTMTPFFKTFLFAVLFSTSVFSFVHAQQVPPDNTELAGKALDKKRAALRQKTDVAALGLMLQTGMWAEARALIEKMPDNNNRRLLNAEYEVLQNNFFAAEQLVKTVLETEAANEKAIALKAFLEIQAWELDKAARTCSVYLKKKSSEKVSLMLGRALLLQKRYPEALAIARQVQTKNPRNAASYLLEADVYFWNQQPEKAEAPLKKSLTLDPFNADARFSYGYAIWRRVDATQLNAMAAQWELALAINPLHYQTHWHWGNGHTNLTYADYAAPDDDSVRVALRPADALVKQNNINAALETALAVEKQFPSSVLPLLHRASVYYSAFESDQNLRLDSAEAIFFRILQRKKHYGPAHNGLSAVIKSKRIPYLTVYDSIVNALKTTNIKDSVNFTTVFPDVAYYPGHLAKAMVWNQLYTSIVYFPFLSKQNNSFRIPPLHVDLAISMAQPSFRYMTTFDNRQWMDIRGVGSGAAAIEYVERGAFLERNVILHEYVHLFHGRVLTDAENRQVRSHYYTAMKEKRTLDYYSQNNESEYLAQTYPAYFEPVKVHPLDFKSMNTTNDLKTKDPGMYAFLDRLVKKETAYLNGDQKAMASNWSQVYLNLAVRSRNMRPETAVKLLDTALQHDPDYLPVYTAYAQLFSEEKNFDSAFAWLNKAKKIDAGYAPLYTAEARVIAGQFTNGVVGRKQAIESQEKLFRKAIQLETDYQELASANIQFREMYRRYGLIGEAVEVADAYAKSGSVISTYLRDRRDDALAFGAANRAILGYASSLDVLKKLIEQKPQQFEYRNLYADALAAHGRFEEALVTLQQAQRILAASGNARPDYALRMAEYFYAGGKIDSAKAALQPFLAGRMRAGSEQLRYIRLLSKTGNTSEADTLINRMAIVGDDFYLGQLAFTRGELAQRAGDKASAIRHFETALEHNAYQPEAYAQLLQLYDPGDALRRSKLKDNAGSLRLKPGPVFAKLLQQAR